MEISSEKLSQIKEGLPSGAQTKIAIEFDCNPSYVNMVLNGKVDMNTSAKKIIARALELMEEQKKEDDALLAKINSVTNQDNKAA